MDKVRLQQPNARKHTHFGNARHHNHSRGSAQMLQNLTPNTVRKTARMRNRYRIPNEKVTKSQ